MASPVLQNQDPLPSSSGNPTDSPIYFEITDTDSDLDISTVEVYVKGVVAWSGDSAQNGYTGVKIPVTNGWGYYIYTPTYYTFGPVSVQVIASDLAANSLDETYTFYVITVESTCNPTTYGYAVYGIDSYGACVGLPVETLVEAVKTEYTCFDFPLQYLENGDLQKTTLFASVENNLRSSIMLQLGSIPLATHLGSVVPLLPFDPNDVTTEATLIQEVLRATRLGEPRASIDTSIVAVVVDNEIKLIVPYAIAGQVKLDSVNLSLPVQSVDGF